MSKRTEDDSRRNPIRNSDRGRARGWSRAAELTRIARAFVIAMSLAGGLAACGAGGITAPPTLESRKFVLADPTGTTPTDHTIIGDDDHDDDDRDDGNDGRVPIRGVQVNCRNGEEVPFEGWGYFSLTTSPDGLTTQLVVLTRYEFEGRGTFGNFYRGGGGHSEFQRVSGLAMTWTIQDRVLMTSRSAPDMFLWMKFHLKIDARGRTVAHFEKTVTNCDDVTH